VSRNHPSNTISSFLSLKPKNKKGSHKISNPNSSHTSSNLYGCKEAIFTTSRWLFPNLRHQRSSRHRDFHFLHHSIRQASGANLNFNKIIKGESQVAAWTNYHLTLSAGEGSVSKIFKAVLFLCFILFDFEREGRGFGKKKDEEDGVNP
ncbi:hypothetical protein RYX36_009006, partial [Vicia faba]